MAYPVTTVRMPAGLVGQPNGRLSTSLLVNLDAPGRPNAVGHRPAVDAWHALASDVLEHFGLTLTVTSTPDAYRSYAVQEWTFRNRYTTTYLAGRPSKVWNGVRWWQKPNTAMAAVPGTSNHGWGLAFDTCFWIDGGAQSIVARMDAFSWMLTNAWRFGLSWEAQSEPWHLRYYAGDDVPQAVRDYLTPPTPAPHPPIMMEDDDMVTCVNRNGQYWLWNLTRKTPLGYPGNDIALIALLWDLEDRGVKFGGHDGTQPRGIPIPVVLPDWTLPTFDAAPTG